MAFILLRKSLAPHPIHLALRTAANLPELMANDMAKTAISQT